MTRPASLRGNRNGVEALPPLQLIRSEEAVMNHALSRRRFLAVAGSAAAGIAIGASPANASLVSRGSHRIGLIGSGAMGGGLGVAWARAGHEILFSSRNPDELADLVASAGSRARAGYPQDAASFGDVVLIAVPYGALPQVGRDYTHLMQGKVVIDC